MNYLYLLPLALLFLAPTYYEGQNFTVGNMEFTTVVASNDQSIAISSEYFTLIIRANRCEVRDAYQFCLTNLTRDYAEFYPHEVRIVLDVENICGDRCVALGYECERNNQCASNYCVHGVCRNQATWCGDGVCDAAEEGVCLEDCPVQEVVEDVAQEEELQEEAAQEEELQEEVIAPETEPQVDEQDPQLESDQRRVLGVFSEQEAREAVARGRQNWPAAVGVVLVCLLLLIVVFRKHRHATI